MKTITKKKATPTIEQRKAEANKLATDALSIFDKAARDLELAAELKDEIAVEVDAKAGALYVQADALLVESEDLSDGAYADRAAAAKVRGLFG